MSALVWVAALFLVGLGIIVLEVFVPSGGVLGFVSLAALVAAVATAFFELGMAAGMGMVALTVVAVPVVLGVAFRWFPQTALGRRVLPPPPEPADVVPDAPGRRRARDLIGRRGRTTSDLLPWGTVSVGDDAIDGVSESGAIDAGTDIEVVGVQGSSVVVRPLAVALKPSARPLPKGHPEAPPRPEDVEKSSPAGEGRLSPTLESFEFDALESPDA
jgi:membrane-bound serine protease (ClpP class)